MQTNWTAVEKKTAMDLCCSCIWYARIDGNSYGYQFLQGE